MNTQMMKANRETARILKDHNRYVESLDTKMRKDTLKNHATFLKKSKREMRYRNCMKKQMEKELKLKIESHEKRVRDQIVNYVRQM